jgi:hypothetical protein
LDVGGVNILQSDNWPRIVYDIPARRWTVDEGSIAEISMDDKSIFPLNVCSRLPFERIKEVWRGVIRSDGMLA